jgi:F0F1-type ATP synthase assembly protein I
MTPSIFDEVKEPEKDEQPVVVVPFSPESTEENVRRSGLAWSAGIAFFGAVAFCLFLGWLADLLLGSSPWGIVGGILLGSIIGFIQFFRLSSQIYSTKKPASEIRPLMSSDEDDKM